MAEVRNFKFFLLAIIFIVAIAVSVAGVSADWVECWTYDGDKSQCDAQTDECYWSAQADDDYCPWQTVGTTTWDGVLINNTEDLGCCYKYDCWIWDEDQTSCEAHSSDMNCQWQANDQNQNPWCSNNNGCCDKQGCWSGDTSAASCSTTNDSLSGLCAWWADGYCGGTDGCCNPMWCSDAGDNETMCNDLMDKFQQPCQFSGATCSDQGMTFFGGMDECLDAGGNWNGSECSYPTFEGFVHCWFADNQRDVCTNITGCVYCINDTNLLNEYWSHFGNISNKSSACYNNPTTWCQGHEGNWLNDGVEVEDIATDSIDCTDIKLKSTCNFGPLPFCKWNSSTLTIGEFCDQGFLTDQELESQKPSIGGATIDFCDDVNVNTSADCTYLKNEFMMPCKWNNKSTTATTDDECTFDWEAVAYGDSKGSMDFYDVQDEGTCVMAGGAWVEENVCGTGSDYDTYGAIDKEVWCEPNTGTYSEDCNDACWACTTETTCNASMLAYCWWNTTSNTCEKPAAFAYEGGDCVENCEYCNYYPTMEEQNESCVLSPAGCGWLIDPQTNVGYCASNTKTGCAADCFSCWDSDACNLSDMHCQWDSSEYFCKPANYTSDNEICFNGKDDDNDGKMDCADPQCATDQFCGGFTMGDCWSQDNDSCINTASSIPGQNCVWVRDDWSNDYHCDMPGWDCWKYDDNSTLCIDTTGCKWQNQSGSSVFCDINMTLGDACFGQTQANCQAANNCTWVWDYWGGGGWCEYSMFAQCGNYTSQASCNNVSDSYFCVWQQNWGGNASNSSDGWCDVGCFNDSLTMAECNAVFGGGLCEGREGWCEPESFMGGCMDYDGNKTGCDWMNASCVWYPDPNGPTAGAGEPEGYCDPKMGHDVWQDVYQDVNMLIFDPDDASPDGIDISDIGIKDLGNHTAFGIGMVDINLSVFCNGYYIPSQEALGTGQDETKVYIYIDSDETTTGGCNALYDGSYYTGFEFMMEYSGIYENNDVTETKLFYKCDATNQLWVLTSIPLYVDKMKSCGELEAIGLAIEEADLQQFTEYDKSKDLRIMVTTANGTATRSAPSDYSDMAYYTPGTMDFNFECCECPGDMDMDGDGLPVKSDPDCEKFKKFGYIPFEDCFTAGDDDSDGLINCADPDCYYAPECSGSVTYDPTTDTEAPKMVWHKVDKFDTGAFVMFDSDKPANGTLYFYLTDGNCSTVNTTIYDIGIIDDYIEDYKNWHDAPIDNMNFNQQALGYDLTAGTTYYYKVTLCGLNGKCSTSACMSFATANSTDFKDCPKCNPIMKFEFAPPPGMGANSPLGAMQFQFKWPGETDYEIQPDFCGLQKPWSNLTNVDWKINNPTAEKTWSIELQNATLSTLDNDEKNVNGSNMMFVEETTGDYVGMNQEQWGDLKKTNPDYFIVEFPRPTNGDCTELWKCDEAVTTCTDLSDTDGVTALSVANDASCRWQVPSSIGFSVYGGRNAPSDGGAAAAAAAGGSESTSAGAGAKDEEVTVVGVEEDITAEAPLTITEMLEREIIPGVSTSTALMLGVILILMIVGYAYYKLIYPHSGVRRHRHYRRRRR